jgi:organic hydroperoxide reductase OsmC/OhrA
MRDKHQYQATVLWQRQDGAAYLDNRYSRAHEWQFDGGITVPASSSPSVVPLPYSEARAVDPEEAFVASLSSCHMLTFLYHAAKKGYVIDRYEDQAIGDLGKNAQGRIAMLKVRLRPAISFGGDKKPSAEELTALHEQSHHDCYIANSVTTEVTVEPR